LQAKNLTVNGQAVATVNATIFPITPQPLITEVYIHFDSKTQDTSTGNPRVNLVPYIAIELFNPFNQTITISSREWQIRSVRREPGYSYPDPQGTQKVADFPDMTIDPGKYVVIDNFDGNNIQYYPKSSKMDSLVGSLLNKGTNYQSITGLEGAVGKELLIVRQYGGASDPALQQVIDSFDSTGFDTDDNLGMNWHYVRASNQDTHRWLCVYPGRYDGNRGTSWTDPRHQGVERPDAAWNPLVEQDPWELTEPNIPVTLGSDAVAGGGGKLGTFPSNFLMCLSQQNVPGPKPLGAGANQFPFGMFARNGDILQVPFISAYTLTTNGPSGVLPVEMNSVSMDAAFAEDGTVGDDPASIGTNPYPNRPEQIGRFSPVRLVNGTPQVDDFDPAATYTPTGTTVSRYHFATRLLDYLTVESPSSDYVPNVSPSIYAQSGAATPPVPIDNNGDDRASDEDDPNITHKTNPPNTVDTTPGSEDNLGVQGLININTAPWKVLATIPWVPAEQNDYTFDPGTGRITKAKNTIPNTTIPIFDNEDIAKAIVRWRDGDPFHNVPGHGPFRSIFDLYRVRASDADPYVFDQLQNEMFGNTDPGVNVGDFSGPDGIRYDCKEMNQIITKVSNLLTTRSDTFTVYILLQGWRLPVPGASSAMPELVVQRRVAFIQDRSSMTASPSSKLAASVNVPAD
jgi:hypothetical protein